VTHALFYVYVAVAYSSVPVQVQVSKLVPGTYCWYTVPCILVPGTVYTRKRQYHTGSTSLPGKILKPVLYCTTDYV
jgi:hypothetical protein